VDARLFTKTEKRVDEEERKGLKGRDGKGYGRGTKTKKPPGKGRQKGNGARLRGVVRVMSIGKDTEM